MKEGWIVKKLGEVCTFQRGLTYSKGDEVESSNNCVLRSNNIDLDRMVIVLDELKYLRDDLKINEDKKVKSNTILICMSNGSKQHIGKVAFINKDYDYAFGGFMGLIIPNNNVSPKYVYYSCLSSSYKTFLGTIGNGANITNLKFSDLEKHSIPIPPLPEQVRIVEELDRLSDIIEKKRQQLSELDNLAQAIFYDMFVSKAEQWQVKSLIDIYKFIDYRGKTPNKIDCGVPLITARNIRRGYIDYTIREFISEAEFCDRQSRGIARKGDLLFTTEAPMGYAAIADLDTFSTGQRLISFQQRETGVVSNVYVLYYLLSDVFQTELNNQATGATVKGIKGSKLEKMIIPLPPLDLQQLFAQKIEAIEKEKEFIKQSIAEVEELFNSRMEEYFG